MVRELIDRGGDEADLFQGESGDNRGHRHHPGDLMNIFQYRSPHRFMAGNGLGLISLYYRHILSIIGIYT